jgi:hypothetical protein
MFDEEGFEGPALSKRCMLVGHPSTSARNSVGVQCVPSCDVLIIYVRSGGSMARVSDRLPRNGCVSQVSSPYSVGVQCAPR